jgi:hypothetical protein
MASIICSSKLSGTLPEPIVDTSEAARLAAAASTVTSEPAVLASATSDHPSLLEYSAPSLVCRVLLFDGSSTLVPEELLSAMLRSSVKDLHLLRISYLDVWQVAALEESPSICCCSAKAATAQANPPEGAASAEADTDAL